MPRIIAGVAGGRRIAVPGGRATRPTGDRAREALFASVQSEVGTLAGRRVLDLFAGSGALGLEALSRGAGHVLLVESSRRAASVIRSNITAVGLDGARVVVETAERALARPCTQEPFDLLLADPPYTFTDAEVAGVLSAAIAGNWLAPEALAVVERPHRGPDFGWPPGFEPRRGRRYGEAVLWYGRVGPRAREISAERRKVR